MKKQSQIQIFVKSPFQAHKCLSMIWPPSWASFHELCQRSTLPSPIIGICSGNAGLVMGQIDMRVKLVLSPESREDLSWWVLQFGSFGWQIDVGTIAGAGHLLWRLGLGAVCGGVTAVGPWTARDVKKQINELDGLTSSGWEFEDRKRSEAVAWITHLVGFFPLVALKWAVNKFVNTVLVFTHLCMQLQLLNVRASRSLEQFSIA